MSGRAPIWLGLVCGAALLAPRLPDAVAAGAKKPPPATASLQGVPGVSVHWDRGVVEAAGSAAADLYAASADVARIKAERLARARAEERLRAALTLLAKEHAQRLAQFGRVAQLAALDPARAQQVAIDYGSNGSVSLRLALKLEVPMETAASKRDDATAPRDGGVPGDGGSPPASKK